MDLIAFHKTAIAIHKAHKALRTGSLFRLLCDGPVIAYGRSQGEDRIVVVVNAGHEPRWVHIPVWIAGADPAGRFVSLLKTSPLGYEQHPEELQAAQGMLALEIKEESAIILQERV